MKLNREKYASKEFKNLWSKINRKSYYTVDFDDQEIIEKSIQLINKNLTVKTLKARITEGNMQQFCEVILHFEKLLQLNHI